MKILILTTLAFVIPLITQVGCQQNDFNPGITASLDINLVENAKNIYWDVLLQFLENIKLDPVIKFKQDNIMDGALGGQLVGNYLIFSQRSENVNIKLEPELNAIHLSIDNLGVAFATERVEYGIYSIRIGAKVFAMVRNVHAALRIGIIRQFLPNGLVVPGFVISDVECKVPYDDVDITIDGGVHIKTAN